MSAMFRILESQAPVKQTATDTIATLCGRLQSATLLEDKRVAILGLRSFAKIYPASVASGALRNLISLLATQRDDPDTTKTVLETLLMLFNPDKDSPEASADIIFWLADEFTQKQENITALLDLLEQGDFFSTLYVLQLILAISNARPERTQECVYLAPLGVSRLVGVLDDGRDAVRSECLLLLTNLTPGNVEFQKMVAFEDAFNRILRIVDQEGGLADGTVVVQDCLSLLANLLRLNASNQMAFRETGGPKRVAELLKPLAEPVKQGEDEPNWNAEQRDRNLWGMLSIIRLFLLGGGSGAQRNQSEFWRQGVTNQVLRIAFNPAMSTTIQAEALATAADLIRKNAPLQEKFAHQEVVLHISPPQLRSPGTQVNGHTNTELKLNIIQALLDLCLNVSTVHDLDLRLAACECIKAYLYGHPDIRHWFLGRACHRHQAPEPEPDNILTILLQAPDAQKNSESYRQWMAAVIFLHLIYDNYELKKMARDVSEGDEAAGEEVVTCIQAMAGNLLAGADRGDDERLSIAYLMVLATWLFEDPDAVNDFLQEGANLQGLVTLVVRNHHAQPLVAGLATFLLGVIYEFSTKDSPIPRSTVHGILTTKLGRDLYDASLTRLREDPAIRDFEVAQQTEPLFDRTFVEFLKDNCSRVMRAIDREPDLEVSVNVGGVEKGVSREQVDGLRAQLEEQGKALEEALDRVQSLERQLGQEQADHRRARETAEAEVQRIGNVNAGLQREHEKEVQRLIEERERLGVELRDKHALESRRLNDELAMTLRRHQDEMQALRSERQQAEAEARSRHAMEIKQIRDEMDRRLKEANAAEAKARERHEAEVQDLRNRLEKAEKALDKVNKEHAQDLKTAYDEHDEARQSLEGRLKRAEERAMEAEKREKDARKAADDAKVRAEEKEGARLSAQTELDDLLIVLGDLEEKRSRDKSKLKELGQEVSDAEDEDGDEEDEDEEEADGDKDDVD